MPVVINTNYAATVAANNLAASNMSLQRSLNRLSSGTKIVNPSDDAGGLAVSMKLSAAAVRQGAVASNIGNATSYLQTQDGALKVTGKILVPYCPESFLSGVQKKQEINMWYRRTFELPASWKNKQVILHFEAVDHDATVFVNGEKVGSHAGGYDGAPAGRVER